MEVAAMRYALVASLLVSSLVLTAPASSTPPPGVGPPPGLVGSFTYSQAVLHGIPTLPTPAQLGLPPCHPDPTWKGFSSPAAAEAALQGAAAEASECAADPTQVVYSVGVPGPESTGSGSGHRYSGAETNAAYQGGRATIEVGNPNVVHDGSVNQFVASRVLAKTPINNWVEAGWAEVSWQGDTRYTYSYANPGRVWHFHTQYPLTTGNYYIWRARDNGNTSGYGEIYWAGTWAVLENNGSMLCQYSYGTNNCYMEEYMEAYSATGSWPSMNAPVDGSGVNFSNTMLRTAPSNYVYWNDSLYPSSERADSPYSVCWTNMDWNFRSPQGLC